MEVVYNNGLLESSRYILKKDGNPYDSTIIVNNNSVYNITQNGNKSTITEPVGESSIKLYFSEPQGVKSILSEVEGIFKSINPTTNDTYVLNDPGNHHTNTYIYSNSQLQKARIEHTLFNFTLSLKN